jgi:microcystin-dependent protein
MAFAAAPGGWAPCDGQLLPIGEHPALFALIGTRYGGDGSTTFALPDLRGRTPIHAGNDHLLGAGGGEEAHTLTTAELPRVQAAGAGAARDDDGAGVRAHGGARPHQNMQPFLTLSFCIALTGIEPAPRR